MTLRIPKKSGGFEKGPPGYEDISAGQRAVFAAEGALVVLAVAELFYGCLPAALALLPGIAYYVKKRRRALGKRRMAEATDAFRETLLLVRSHMSAGISPENAWRAARREITALYPPTSPVVAEMDRMCAALDMNQPFEKALQTFSDRLGMPAAQDFCQVFALAKRTGGNFNAIVTGTIERISEKMEVEREIRTLTSGKRFEQLIMNLIPVGILVYMRISSPGYMDALYGNLTGVVIMSVCLAVYLGAYEASGRIVEIEV
ncbi:MAG: type II secretion system F family protein [Eubacterium sp.]|nr:type II secretion system F family protein [Eubacterium sp.]